MVTATAKAPLAAGELITFQAGRAVIRLQCARVNAAYTVVVETGTYRVEDNCCAVDNETCARQVARIYAELYLMEV